MPQRKAPTAIANAAQKYVPRHAMGDLVFEGQVDPITKIAAALGALFESGQNVLDPQYEGVDVNLPNDSGEFDPRIIDAATRPSPPIDTTGLTRPRKLPRKPMQPPLHLPSKGTP